MSLKTLTASLLKIFFGIILAVLLPSTPCFADRGYVLLLVQDMHKRPVKGIQIGIEGAGGTQVTGDDGKALLPVSKGTTENDWVSLYILQSPRGHDYAIISPIDNRSLVPSFRSKAEDFIRVAVVERGDLAALQNGDVVTALAARINKKASPLSSGSTASPANVDANLNQVATEFKFKPDDVDHAIRSLGEKTDNEYQAGVVALYERRYAAATKNLMVSLETRQKRLARDEQLVTHDREEVKEAAFSLGLALFWQGRYQAASTNFKIAADLNPDDPFLAGQLGVSLLYSADPNAAEEPLCRSLELSLKLLGTGNPLTATAFVNMGGLRSQQGRRADSEVMYRRALALEENIFGASHPMLVNLLIDLGSSLLEEQQEVAAAVVFDRAKSILQSTNYPNLYDVAHLNYALARSFETKGDFETAAGLFQDAMFIHQNILGPDHPLLVKDHNALAGVHIERGDDKKYDYDLAMVNLTEALDIGEKVLGPKHPDIAETYTYLGILMEKDGNYEWALDYYRTALQIDEAALGSDHPTTQATHKLLDRALNSIKVHSGK